MRHNRYDIGDDEIRVIGSGRRRRRRRRIIVAVAAAVVVVAALVWMLVKQHTIPSQQMAAVEEMENEMYGSVEWQNNADVTKPSCIDVTDTIVDGLHLRIYTPYNTMPELHIGMLDTTDSDILLTTMAADLRRDNGKIVGAFVLAGEPLSWGLSKRGYCAIINGCVTIGVAENSSLFEQATEEGGYFFRQYPAVDNGVMVENRPANASFRRALCMFDGKVSLVRCIDRVLMNDFSRALVHLGVSDAILLVGGYADGWSRNSDGTLDYFGILPAKEAEYMNYIVFRKQ